MASQKTPYFILDKEKLESNYKEFNEQCERFLGKDRFEIAYSVKTNSLPEVIKILSSHGSGFEVASLGEIKLVNKSKGLKIFNGPCKTMQEVKLALKDKMLINVDSISEINKISSLIKKPLDACLRVSFLDSKFGINELQVKSTLEYAKTKKINIVGLHFHLGTQQNLKEYEENLIMFENLLGRLTKEYKFNFMDVGGGFPDKQQLKNIGKTLEDYLLVIKNYLGKFNAKIILEPGRAIVSDSMILVTKVQVIKENLGKNYAILDAGINLLPKITLASYKFSKFHADKNETKEKSKEYWFAGPLLFSNDILGKFQGNLNEGDLIKVENVGAYCLNLAWGISYGVPRVVLV